MREIAEGLAEAHAHGIVHRDLKASNVMITAAGRAKILDFGLAKRYSGVTEADISAEGAIVGTFHAMSPEQAQGLTVDHRSDLFSLGTLLYEMLTGMSPFRGDTPQETLARVCAFTPREVRDINPHVPEPLARSHPSAASESRGPATPKHQGCCRDAEPARALRLVVRHLLRRQDETADFHRDDRSRRQGAAGLNGRHRAPAADGDLLRGRKLRNLARRHLIPRPFTSGCWNCGRWRSGSQTVTAAPLGEGSAIAC